MRLPSHHHSTNFWLWIIYFKLFYLSSHFMRVNEWLYGITTYSVSPVPSQHGKHQTNYKVYYIGQISIIIRLPRCQIIMRIFHWKTLPRHTITFWGRDPQICCDLNKSISSVLFLILDGRRYNPDSSAKHKLHLAQPLPGGTFGK